MHQIVHRIEIGRAWGIAEAGMCRRDNLGTAREQIQELRSRVDRLHAVQGQDGLSRAAAQNLQCDVANPEPVR